MKMEDIQDLHSDTSLNKATVVNLDSCMEDQISSENLLQLAQLPRTVLSDPNNVTLGNYINFNGAENLLNTGVDEPAQIQFLVIHGQSENLSTPYPTQSHSKTTDDITAGHSSEEQGEDRLLCGRCKKVCFGVLEFLDHKATHIGRGLGLGCEVCSLTFSRTNSLHNHYLRKHKITLAEKTKKVDTSKNVAKERKKCIAKQKPAVDPSTKKQEVTGVIERMNNEINTELVTGAGEGGKAVEDATTINISDGLETKACNKIKSHKLETIHENQLQTESKRDNNHGWIGSEVIPGTNTDTAVLQTVQTDCVHGQLTNVPILECVTETPELTEGIIHTENNGQNIQAGEILTRNNDDTFVKRLTNTPPGYEKENAILALENVQHVTEEIGHNKNTTQVKENSFLPSYRKMDFDLSSELEMPDFYFIAVIERGPRNSIKGCKYHFKCLYCESKLSWRNTMCQHMKEKHPDILEMGPVLNISQQNLEKKHKVIKMSEYVKLEKTKRSGKRFRGIETQDLPGHFPCARCGKVFHRLRNLRKHEVLHQAEKNLLCSICVKSFKTLANLNQHMRTHKEREAYKCKECDFESTVNILIHAHRQIHKDGCVLCDICGCAYNDKSTLTKHKNVHDLTRPYACTFPGCTWRFKSKSMCSAHVKGHTTKPKFECKVCQYAFRQKHHLQRHEAKIHNITPDNKCMYTVLPVSFVDEGVIVTDETKLMDMESKPIQREVSLIINENSEVSVDEQFDLESALQNGQLVIATDNDGNTINYEMGDMGLSVSYQTLLPDGDRQHMDAQTILIPQTEDGQILYQHEEVTETICTEVNTSGETVS